MGDIPIAIEILLYCSGILGAVMAADWHRRMKARIMKPMVLVDVGC